MGYEFPCRKINVFSIFVVHVGKDGYRLLWIVRLSHIRIQDIKISSVNSNSFNHVQQTQKPHAEVNKTGSAGIQTHLSQISQFIDNAPMVDNGQKIAAIKTAFEEGNYDIDVDNLSDFLMKEYFPATKND